MNTEHDHGTADLGSPAPDFALPTAENDIVSREDFSDAPMLLVFLSPSSPFTELDDVLDHMADLAVEYKSRGVGVVGVVAESAVPERFEKLPFPVVRDVDRETAEACGAVGSPDFFLYDRNHTLAYRGRMGAVGDGSPADAAVTGADLRAALDDVVAGRPVRETRPPGEPTPLDRLDAQSIRQPPLMPPPAESD